MDAVLYILKKTEENKKVISNTIKPNIESNSALPYLGKTIQRIQIKTI